MKQFQFSFRENKTLEAELRKLRRWVKSTLCSHVTVRIFTEVVDRERIERVCETVGRLLPEALYVGCSTNGNILNGDFSSGAMVVVCTLFEYPTTKLELLQYPMPFDDQASVAGKLAEEVEKRPWVKAVELLVTIRGQSMTTLCEGLSRVRPGVQIYGGGAFCKDMGQDEACVFSSAGGYMEEGVAFILLGGDDVQGQQADASQWQTVFDKHVYSFCEWIGDVVHETT